jgi:hypothetical protein
MTQSIVEEIAALPMKPKEPEFLDGNWYYRGFSQYREDEAYRVYNSDRVLAAEARLALLQRAVDGYLAARDAENINASSTIEDIVAEDKAHEVALSDLRLAAAAVREGK